MPGKVADPAAKEQQGAEGQRVPGNDPLQVSGAKCSSRLMVGSATLTMLKSSCRTNCAATTSPSAMPSRRIVDPSASVRETGGDAASLLGGPVGRRVTIAVFGGAGSEIGRAHV